MRSKLAAATAVVLLAAVLSVASASAHAGHEEDGAEASADVSVSVSVDGTEVSDGETLNVEEGEVFVNVTVESDNELNSLTAEFHNKTVSMGINETSHRQSYVVESRPGPNLYTVTARDLSGNTAVHSVDLYREPKTALEMKTTVDRLERRIATVEDEITELEERREELERANEDLEERLVALQDSEANEEEVASGKDSNEEEPNAEETQQTLPGFTVVAGLVAVVVGLFAVYRSRREP